MIDATQHLTSNYKKRPDSNNAKLLGLANAEMNELVDVFKKIEDSRDIDKAYGKTLDKAGKNVLEYRNGRTDEEYREHIKIKIIANMSQGDINTINQVAEFFLGDDFLGIEEAWRNPLYDELAGIIIHIKPPKRSIPSVLRRIKAGGVSLYWEVDFEEHTLVLKTRYKRWGFGYPLTNEHHTAAMEGKSFPGYLSLKTRPRHWGFTYPLANTDYARGTGGKSYNSTLQLASMSQKWRFRYPLCGISVTGGEQL